MLVGLGHVELVCRDLPRSLAFYAAVFGPLGLEDPLLVEGERGEQIHYLRFPTADRPPWLTPLRGLMWGGTLLRLG